MELKTMYKGIAFSPPSILTQTLGETDHIIYVANPEYFPDGPNVATIGTDADAETIYYASKIENALSGCTRGVEGKPKAWQSGEIIGRNYTANDYHKIIENILKLKEELEKQVENLSGEDTKLLNKINVFLERGYLSPTFVGTESISTLPTGFYSKWVGTEELPAFDQFNFIRLQGQDPSFISTIGIHPVRGDMIARGNDNDTWQQIATTETVDVSTLVLLNGFERHGDLSFGIISRSGNNVHLSLLLVENGVGASYVSTIICALPFRPVANEIHFLDGYEFRTQVDGHLYLNGPLANTRRLIRLSINYTCA